MYDASSNLALVRRTSTGTTTTSEFAGTSPGVRDGVLDPGPREAACCPFLSSKSTRVDDPRIVGSPRIGASDWAVMDEFLGDTAGLQASSSTIAEQLGARGGIPILVPADDV